MFKRLSPKIKISHTSWKMWKAKDWEGLKAYYYELEGYTNIYMERGKEIHKRLEEVDIIPEVKKLSTNGKWEKEKYWSIDLGEYEVVGIIDVMTDDVIVDYKAGGIEGYAPQMNLYNWATGGNRKMYLVQVDDFLQVGKIREVKKKDYNWEVELKRMGEDLFNYFLK